MEIKQFLKPGQVLDMINVHGSMKIADLGSGSGHFSIEAARRLSEGGVVYSFDIQQPALEALHSQARMYRLLNIETLKTNLELIGSTKLKDEIIDLVIMSNVLFQVDNKKTFLEEAGRILKKEGNALIIDWEDTPDTLGPELSKLINKESLKTIMIEIGFEFVKEIPAGSHHYGLLFKKL